MKRTAIKILSACVCAAVTVSSLTASAYAVKKETPVTSETAAVSKDETVYVFANADGSVKKLLVSDWLKNPDGSEAIRDLSGLQGIETVKGDETYTAGSGNQLIWNAEGSDIYYQGETEQKPPVELSVTYTLDGRKISAEELAGKSGKVRIRFDYKNCTSETVEIDGKKEKIYVPFAVLTGVLLDDQVFSNVEVSNGRLINDGDRSAVVGMAFPGLQSDLKLDRDTLEIPDYVEITADVKEFELATTVTIVTNTVFNSLDTASLDSAEDLADALDELTEAMDALVDGSSELYEGISTLSDKSGELTEGVNQLSEGAGTLKNGAAELDEGASSLAAGAQQLYAGLSELAANNSSLTGGAGQVFQTLLSTAETQLKAAGIDVPTLTIANYAQVLNSVIASLDESNVYQQALQSVTAAVEQKRSLIEEQVTEAVRQQVAVQVQAAVREQVISQVTATVRAQLKTQIVPEATEGAYTADTYDAAVANGSISDELYQAVEAAIDTQLASDSVQQQISAAAEQQMAADTVLSTIETQTAAQMQTAGIQTKISENVELTVKKTISEQMSSEEVLAILQNASKGAESVIALKASLDSYNGFYLGLMAYTDGVSSALGGAAALSQGASELKSGTAQLSAGAVSLSEGLLQLQSSLPALTDGVSQLQDGSLKLSDGLQQFREEGIQKLTEAVEEDLEPLIARVKATADVSAGYQSFSGLGKDMSGQVKFIYRTDSIGEEE